jgi:hypothetical protein
MCLTITSRAAIEVGQDGFAQIEFFGAPCDLNISSTPMADTKTNLAGYDQFAAAISVPKMDSRFIRGQSHLETVIIERLVVWLVRAPG